MKIIKLIIILIGLLGILTNCGNDTVPAGLEFAARLTPEVLSDFSYLKIDYSIKLSNKFKSFTKDYRIFVHFWRLKTKTMILQDDHNPTVATSKWKTGDHFVYSRKLFVPKFIDELDIDFEGFEDIRLTLGLYWPKKDGKKIILLQQDRRFQPASYISPGQFYSQGWNGLESSLKVKDPQRRKWRWTTGKAVCLIENIQKKSTLIIKGRVSKNILGDQQVILKINDNIIDKFIPKEATFSRTFTLTKEQLGKEDEFILSIETDKTFTPSSINPKSNDNRELGIQIYLLYFRESLD